MGSAALGVVDQTLFREREYWLKKLSGDFVVTGVPLDHERPALFSDQREVTRFPVPAETDARLQQVCGNNDSLLFTIFLAALKICLHKYSGVEDIIVGSAIHEQFGDVASLNKVLATRDRVAGSITVRELLENVKLTISEAYANQKYPFERILSLLNIESPNNQAPLFSIVAIMDGINDRENIRHLKNDITQIISRGDDGINIEIEWNPTLFRSETISLFGRQYRRVLDSILNHPDARVEEIELVSEEERRRLLLERNATQRPFPQGKAIHELFAEQSGLTPHAVALVSEAGQVTYRELNARSNQLAHHLRGLGIGPGDLVGICAQHVLELVIALLGALKSGAAYVPIDPRHPPARRALILSDAGACLVLTYERAMEDFPEDAIKRLCLDDDWPAIALESEADPVSMMTFEDGAYVIYTSGSTGEPKGVLVSHRSLVDYISWAREVYLQGEELAFALYSSIAFDLTVTSVYLPLISGGPVVIYAGNIDEPPLEEILSDNQVDVLKVTPSHLSLIKDRNNRGSRVKRLIVGGESLATKVAREVYESFGCEVEIFNEYGPTEATVGCAVHRFDPERDDRPTVPIGLPGANAQMYVLDQFLNPAAENVIGELYVGGEGLARAYLGRSAFTAERFLAHPFVPGERIYRTGDLAKWLADGVLDFVGRADDQVKLRGYRLEMNEVRCALNQHPQIRDSAVLVTKDGQDHQVLMAYYVSRREVEVADLRAFLVERLIRETIPNVFVHMKRLPLTLNGKVNYRALPTLEMVRARTGRGYVAPRTAAEQALVDVWTEIFGSKHIGIHDNFFELGGDSILSIRIAAKANNFGLGLIPRQIFEHQTIAQLAAAADVSRIVKADQRPITGRVPLTPIQEWFFEQELAEPNHYNHALMLKTRENVDVGSLEKAIGKLMEQHDALRMRFEKIGGRWEQESMGIGGRVPVVRVDLREVKREGRRRELEKVAGQMQKSMELSGGRVIVVGLIEGGEDGGGRLLIIIHHLVIDGVSWRILLEDLVTGYEQARRGEQIELPVKTTSYQEWAKWLSEYAETDELRKEAEYWVGGSGGDGIGRVPVDYDGGENTVGSTGAVKVELSEEETEELLQVVPEAYRTQINEVLITAVVEALMEWTGGKRIRIHVEGHGREEMNEGHDWTRTVGWFTSLHPIEFTRVEGSDAGEALKEVKEQMRRMPKRGIGYGVLRYLSRDEEIGKEMKRAGGAEVSFNYLGQLDRVLGGGMGIETAEENVGWSSSRRNKRSHLVEISGMVIGGRMEVEWRYSENVHRRESIEEVAGKFKEKLRRLIEHCTRAGVGVYTASDFPMVGLNEQELRDALGSVDHEGRIEDIYPLSPLQEGMVFHSLYSPDSGAYVAQVVCTLAGLNTDAFKRAWQEIIERHQTLRTVFMWRNPERLLQVVCGEAETPLREDDWRGLSAGECGEELERYLEADRLRGFELTRPPLMRLALFRLDDETYQFVWTHHHLLLDGWSLFFIFKELLILYGRACGQGDAELEPSRPYRDYIAWLGRQDLREAERFWRGLLKGLTGPTSMMGIGEAPERLPGRRRRYEERQLALSGETTKGLERLARERRLTLNTVVQGAWAMLLSWYSGEEDILFGSVVSGRPPGLAGVETMVGLFINTLPMRVKVLPEAGLSSWLEGLQDRLVELRQYEYSPLAEVQKWSEIGRGLPLFESIYVFENYPMDASMPDTIAGLTVRDIHAVEYNNYPLSVVIAPGSKLLLTIHYDGSRFSAIAIDRVLRHFGFLLRKIHTESAITLSKLVQMLVEEDKRHSLEREKEIEEAGLGKLRAVKRRVLSNPTQSGAKVGS